MEHDDGRIEVIDGRAFNAAIREALAIRSDGAEAFDETEEWPEVRMPFPLPDVATALAVVVGDAP